MVENVVRKGKMLVTSNFSFSHNVFHSYISSVHQNVSLCRNGLNKTDTDSQQKEGNCRRKTLWEKKKTLDTSIFSFSHKIAKKAITLNF